jgi:hypothetical protein
MLANSTVRAAGPATLAFDDRHLLDVEEGAGDRQQQHVAADPSSGGDAAPA